MGDKTQRERLGEAEVKAQAIAQWLGEQMPEGGGFCLMLTTFGQKGYSTYVSNCKRPDIIDLLRESADTLEAKMDALPGVLPRGGGGHD